MRGARTWGPLPSKDAGTGGSGDCSLEPPRAPGPLCTPSQGDTPATGRDTPAKHRGCGVTCQHRARAASAGAARAGDIPPAPVPQPWPRDGSGEGRTPTNGRGIPPALPGACGGSPAPQMCSLPAQEARGDEHLLPLPTHLEPSPAAAPSPPRLGQPELRGRRAQRPQCPHAALSEAVPNPGALPVRLRCPEAIPNLFPFPVSVSPCRGGNGGKSSKTLLPHKLPAPGAARTPSPRAGGFSPCPWKGPRSPPGTALEDAGVRPCSHARAWDGRDPLVPAGLAGLLGSLGTPKPGQHGVQSPGPQCCSRHGQAKPLGGLGETLAPSTLPGRAEPPRLPRQDPRQGLGSVGTKAAASPPPPSTPLSVWFAEMEDS